MAMLRKPKENFRVFDLICIYIYVYIVRDMGRETCMYVISFFSPNDSVERGCQRLLHVGVLRRNVNLLLHTGYLYAITF